MPICVDHLWYSHWMIYKLFVYWGDIGPHILLSISFAGMKETWALIMHELVLEELMSHAEYQNWYGIVEKSDLL